jgi:hypothetical protein
MAVGMPVYTHMYNLDTDDRIYRPKNGQTFSGGHAIEVLGWGHDKNGMG